MTRRQSISIRVSTRAGGTETGVSADSATVTESLEAATPAQKHLLRAGPANAAKLQRKLRELRF